MADEKKLYDIAIIGGGPGGMTAGIYAGRSMLKTLVVDKMALGGAVLLSSHYDNFPAFPEGISGFDLAQKMELQLKKYDVDIQMDDVTSLKFYKDGPLFELVGYSESYYAKTIILASGSTPKPLKVPGAKDLLGRGISTCAVCDGAFYKELDVAVVGGGDAAVEESVYLTKFAKSVTIIHRRDELRAKPEVAKHALKNPKVHVKWDTVIEEVYGKDRLEGLKVKNVKTGDIEDMKVSGLFVYIGATGNTGFIDLPVEMDDWGYIKAGCLGETNVKGLYAIGDVRYEPFKQAIIACGQGAQAALTAEGYLKEIPSEALAEFE